jgi:hypothetical protein
MKKPGARPGFHYFNGSAAYFCCGWPAGFSVLALRAMSPARRFQASRLSFACRRPCRIAIMRAGGDTIGARQSIMPEKRYAIAAAVVVAVIVILAFVRF